MKFAFAACIALSIGLFSLIHDASTPATVTKQVIVHHAMPVPLCDPSDPTCTVGGPSGQ
jgi:hypothetical protein